MASEIKISKTNSRREGACNGCTDHIDFEHGTIKPHEITQVQLRGTVFNLCNDCKQQLIERLQTP